MNPIVAIIAPGMMGAAVGKRLVDHGLKVLTSLQGRTEETRLRAQAAGMISGSDEEIAAADLILSILPPGDAVALAQRFAPALTASNSKPVFVDCNAVSPNTVERIAAAIAPTGAPFVDAGIIGGPPTQSGTRFFASGPGAAELVGLSEFGLDWRLLEGEVGQASGLKMCYAAMTKGLQALGAELLVAARLLGVEDTLRDEQNEGASLAAVRQFVERALPTMPPKAYRWIGEMEEIARTFEDLGLPGRMLLGAADVYTNVRDGGLLATELPVTPATRV